jgi:hypothetical protein
VCRQDLSLAANTVLDKCPQIFSATRTQLPLDPAARVSVLAEAEAAQLVAQNAYAMLSFCFQKLAHPSVLLQLLQWCPALVFVPDYFGTLPYYTLQADVSQYQDVILRCIYLCVFSDDKEVVAPARHRCSLHHFMAHATHTQHVEDVLDFVGGTSWRRRETSRDAGC